MNEPEAIQEPVTEVVHDAKPVAVEEPVAAAKVEDSPKKNEPEVHQEPAKEAVHEEKPVVHEAPVEPIADVKIEATHEHKAEPVAQT